MSARALELERKVFRPLFGVRRKRRDFGGYPPVGKSADPSETAGSFSEPLPLPPDASFNQTLENQAALRDDDDNNDNKNGDDNGHSPLFEPSTRHISELADLLSEASDGEFTRQQALDFLLHTAGGRKMAVRTRHAKRAAQKETNMQSQSELMSDVVKQYGIVPFCKSVAAGDIAVSEHELTSLIAEDAQRRGTTFAKVFGAQTPEGVTLRKAINAVKEAQWAKQGTVAGIPMSPILPTWSRETDINNPRDALAALNAMAQKMKDAAPDGMTFAQAFARTYSDPKNARLAAFERAQSRAKLPTVGGKAVGE
jgi:hypothetical protein